jgi:hypothetical protein
MGSVLAYVMIKRIEPVHIRPTECCYSHVPGCSAAFVEQGIILLLNEIAQVEWGIKIGITVQPTALYITCFSSAWGRDGCNFLFQMPVLLKSTLLSYNWLFYFFASL